MTSVRTKPKSVFLLSAHAFSAIYSEETRQRLGELTDILHEPISRIDENNPTLRQALAQADVVFSGWGAPVFDENLLAMMPRLKAIFYGAGSIKGIITRSVWARDILVTSAYRANAIPVADFTLAQVILALKKCWQHERRLLAGVSFHDKLAVPGVYKGSTVGIISLGAIGSLVVSRLQSLDLSILAYDPCKSEVQIREMGAEPVGLEQIFSDSDVVTLHSPSLPETYHMIRGHHFQSMREGATFINTARGSIVHEQEMIQALKKRKDLFVLLDVAESLPIPSDSPLLKMENVMVTPHIAGSMGHECYRMGEYVATECECFCANVPPLWPVTFEESLTMA